MEEGAWNLGISRKTIVMLLLPFGLSVERGTIDFAKETV